MTTDRSPIERYPVVAILGRAAGSEWQISGSGILVSSKQVLTINHVVRTPMHSSRRRIFSPLEGIRTIEDDVKIHFLKTDTGHDLSSAAAGSPSAGLALVELESEVRGIRPARVRYELPDPGLILTCVGFGGAKGGLVELREIDVEVGKARGSSDFFISRKADPGRDESSALGPGESGCPLLIRENAESGPDVSVFGIYFGLDDRGKRIGLGLEPVREDLQKQLKSASSSDPEWRVDGEHIETGTIGVDEVKTHGFRTHRKGRLLSVTVAAASIPDGYLPEIRLRVHSPDPDKEPALREYESWYQTARIQWPDSGTWRAEIESVGGAVQYQLRWTFFVTESAERSPGR